MIEAARGVVGNPASQLARDRLERALMRLDSVAEANERHWARNKRMIAEAGGLAHV